MSWAGDYAIVKVTKTSDKFNYFQIVLIEVGTTSSSKEVDDKVVSTRKVVGNECAGSCLLVALRKEEEDITKILEGRKFETVNVRSLSLNAYPKSESVRISQCLKFRPSKNCN